MYLLTTLFNWSYIYHTLIYSYILHPYLHKYLVLFHDTIYDALSLAIRLNLFVLERLWKDYLTALTVCISMKLSFLPLSVKKTNQLKYMYKAWESKEGSNEIVNLISPGAKFFVLWFDYIERIMKNCKRLIYKVF